MDFYICVFVVMNGFIVHVKQVNLQVQNYATSSEPIHQIITTEKVLETVSDFLKAMNSENLYMERKNKFPFPHF